MDIQKEIDRLKFENEEHQAIIKVSKECITANNRKIRKLETTLEVVKEIVRHEEFDPASGKMVEKVGGNITPAALPDGSSDMVLRKSITESPER